MAQINSPFIIRFLKFFEDENYYHLLFEKVKGKNLFKYLIN